MRDGWNRATDELSLSKTQIEHLLRPCFAGREILEAEPAEGGLANTNIRIKVEGMDNAVLLRIFVRDPQQAEKEVRITERLMGLLPMPQIHLFEKSNSVTQHPYLVRDWTVGERVETLIQKLDNHHLLELGRSIGRSLAAINSVKFEQPGFLNGSLQIVERVDLGSKGMLDYADACLSKSEVTTRLGEKLTTDLRLFLQKYAPLLDEWRGEPCLTHSDFGGSNILAHCDNGQWKVSGIIDWEFAFSGSPFFDFGNLLRKPLGAIRGFESAVREGYEVKGPPLPENWRQLSLLTDLTAWLDFMTRSNVGEKLVQDARTVILETMSSIA